MYLNNYLSNPLRNPFMLLESRFMKNKDDKIAKKKAEAHVKIVVGYIRVSSLDQVKDHESLPRQEEKIRSYCKLKGLDQPLIIADEGVSGFKDNRQGFQKLVELCKKGRVKTLIVYDLSRLSRSVRSTLSFIEDLIQKQGISFVSLCQDIDTESPHGKAFLTLISVFNQLYRDEISFKTRAALAYKKQKGEKYSGEVPYGFTSTGDGKLNVCIAEQEVILRVRELRAEGHSSRAIARILESDGIRTKKGNKQWRSQTVLNLLKRSANDGP
jgi:site-specific DNA recombinase